MNKLGFRGTAVAAVATLALGGVAGCGNSGSAGGGSGGQASGQSGSSGSSATTQLTKANFASVVSRAVQQKKSAHMTMSMGSQMQGVGDVKYAAGGPEMKMTMTMGGHKMQMRYVDQAMYLKAAGLPSGNKFLKITKASPMMGQMIGKIQSFGPQGSIQMMKKGLKKLKDVGSTTIGGQKVEHYRATIDTRALVAKMGMPKSQMSQVPNTMTEDVYLGSGNLLRRAIVNVMGNKVVVNATKWGEPVHVQAPPASQVTKMSKSMMGGSTGSGSMG
ncbi:MAG: hypothetical protein ACRDPH_09980 [Marmoricola sp.]